MTYPLRTATQEDEAFRAAVLTLWREKYDTFDIARLTGAKEAEVYTALHLALEASRG